PRSAPRQIQPWPRSSRPRYLVHALPEGTPAEDRSSRRHEAVADDRADVAVVAREAVLRQVVRRLDLDVDLERRWPARDPQDARLAGRDVDPAPLASATERGMAIGADDEVADLHERVAERHLAAAACALEREDDRA